MAQQIENNEKGKQTIISGRHECVKKIYTVYIACAHAPSLSDGLKLAYTLGEDDETLDAHAKIFLRIYLSILEK